MSRPDDDATTALRAAWSDYARLNDELMTVALGTGDLDEGSAAALLRRLVGHLAFSALQLHGDPARPELVNTQYSPWNWGHSNPDTLYLSAKVDDAHDYRVSGVLGSASATTFGMYTGMADQSSAVKVLADDLDIGPDGEFELFFTRERHEGNWFELPRGATSFASYQTFGDWESQRRGTIRLECLTDPAPASPATLDEALAAFRAHLEDSRSLFTMWVRDIPAGVFGALPRNAAIPPMQPPSAMAGTWFSPIPWELGTDEALVIEYDVPDRSPYLGLCLTNRWSEMIDVADRQTSLNLAQSQVVDGRVRVLLSTQDHGVHNWLDARGYRSGIATWRVTRAEAPPGPTVTVISTSEVDDWFDPAQRVSEAERSAALARRRRHFAARNTP
ncbi:hypothetical protein [Nocardioides sp.]|uniref:hypothetical protein n=1 Tax=Nocardioides sp. TaxID=35761 RepID=UPI001A259FA7|nr:hypothetical protein [Nocardioides sp.]MBJ7358738.1 hypothetical protein [Nocardioides sp.]